MREGLAPRFFARLSSHSVPLRAILLCGVLSLVCVLSKNLNAQRLFVFLIASTAQVGCLAWVVIGVCLLKYRSLVEKGQMIAPEVGFKTPFPRLTASVVIVVNIIIIVGGWFGTDGPSMLVAEGAVTLLLLMGYCVAKARISSQGCLE